MAKLGGICHWPEQRERGIRCRRIAPSTEAPLGKIYLDYRCDSYSTPKYIFVAIVYKLGLDHGVAWLRQAAATAKPD